MTELTLEQDCIKVIRSSLAGSYVWKIADKTTGGQPDLEVAWAGHTTKIEFKYLKGGECIHDKWEDERQLVTCVRYERATHRCWVVAYRKPSVKHERPLAETIIYRPSKLLDRKIPYTAYTSVMEDSKYGVLWNDGAIGLYGFNHAAIVALIRATHR